MQKTFSNFDQKWKVIDSGSGSDELRNFRKKKRSELLETEYPNRRVEEWKYTSVLSLGDLAFEAPRSLEVSEQLREKLLDSQFHNILLVDGYLDPICLRNLNQIDGLKASSIADAYSQKFDVLREVSMKLTTKWDTPFLKLNDSMLSEGVCLEVADSAVVEKPIRVIHLNLDMSVQKTVQPRIVLRCGKFSKAALIQHFVCEGQATTFTNVVTELELMPGAHLSQMKIIKHSNQAVHVGVDRVTLSRDSVFSDMNACLSGKLVRQDLNVILNGENSEAHLNGIYVGKGYNHFDNHLNVVHRKPHATSTQTYKGVLGDHSRAVFNGKIIVERDAQKTDASQLNKNLLLSNSAEIDSKPELLVDADDVKAAHGATVSQLDENEVFYFQTRGIEKDTAESMLSKGFVDEVIFKEKNLLLRKTLEKEMADVFPNL